jgi:hypothetical protein
MLHTEPHLQASDDFYDALLHAHHGLTVEESHAMNARLILLLANHIGDQATLARALDLARGRVQGGRCSASPTAVTPVVPSHAQAPHPADRNIQKQ